MHQPIDETVSSAETTATALDVFATWAVRSMSTRDLSLTTISTLAELDRAGPTRLSELAVRASVAQPSMTALVGRLVRDGLAERSSDPTDGRVVIVAISARGRAVLVERRRRRVDAIAAIVEQTDADDRALISAAAPALIRLAELATTLDRAGVPTGPTAGQETVS